jgi:hypothetical protein
MGSSGSVALTIKKQASKGRSNMEKGDEGMRWRREKKKRWSPIVANSLIS